MPPDNPVEPVFLFRRRTAGALPPVKFGRLVGTFDHATRVPEGGTRPDDNHLYLWVRVPNGRFAGLYECAFNIHSTDQTNVSFADWPEDLTGEIPSPGFTRLSLSYAALGLQDADFAPVRQGGLQALVTRYAETCTRMAAYGTAYSEGTGLHDIHLNAGEPPGSPHANRTGQDGALVFYFGGANGAARSAHWIFTKFSTQSLRA